MSPENFRGRLIVWNDDKGFGFIKHADAQNHVFLHISALEGMARRPVVGDMITFQITEDEPGKPRAVHASIEGVARGRKSSRSQKTPWNVVFAIIISLILVYVLLNFFVFPATNEDCVIKGNISVNSGMKYYHLPGMKDYEATEISPEKGERWFCTEEEARANGWVKAPE
jgi:cold shock CspA family protein